MKRTDVLVIGSGAAGLTTAIYLAKLGRNVTVLAKSEDLSECNTRYAQGGIIYKGINDNPEKLVRDIEYAGAGLCYNASVKVLAEEGPKLVEELLIKSAGVPFTGRNGKMHLTAEGGHRLKRIIHCDDTTGYEVEFSLLKYAKTFKNIKFEAGKIAVDLITDQHHSNNMMARYKNPECFGAYVFDTKKKSVVTYLAVSTVLATGGLGRIYLHTTNPEVAVGDGYAMAQRAGADLINMEYTQFHPTTLFHRDANRFLISEAVRGEGGILVTQDGRKFMNKYHKMGSLAPRDVVTRGILEELYERNEQFVYLDLSSIDKQTLSTRFPAIRKKCEEYNIDILHDPIPVVPAFHFSCGGVRVNSRGASSLSRLYAIGEVSCTGVHGANRLASTSLLECCVWGKRAANDINSRWDDNNKNSLPKFSEWIDHGLEEFQDPALIAQDWNTLRNIMWNYAGPIRTHKRLKRAIIDLRNLQEDIEDFYRNTKLTRSTVELHNGVTVALSIVRAAISTRSSRGCHYIKDE